MTVSVGISFESIRPNRRWFFLHLFPHPGSTTSMALIALPAIIDRYQDFLILMYSFATRINPSMKKVLVKMSNWRFILPLFVLFLIFPTILFPHYQDRMNEIAGQEILPLDSRFSYSYSEVKNDFDMLGSEGRDTYRFVIANVDMVFAVFYGSLFILVLAWLLKKIVGKDSGLILLSLFPLIGILFEYVENFNTLSLLDNYPDITAESVSLGEQMTQLKHIFLLLSVAFMPLLAITLLIKRFKRQQTPSTTKH